MRVFLDAGHGGKDPGACDGTANDAINTRESDIALDCTMKLGGILQRCGIEPGYSRWADTYPTLEARAASANSWGANIFVSWHFNAYTDGGAARGIEVLYYPTSVKGKALAQSTYDALTACTPWADRGLKARDNLYVLHATKMPAIIIEAGFVTNTEEEALIADANYRTALAEAAARGLCKYLGVAYVPATPAPAVVVETPVVVAPPTPEPTVPAKTWQTVYESASVKVQELR